MLYPYFQNLKIQKNNAYPLHSQNCFLNSESKIPKLKLLSYENSDKAKAQYSVGLIDFNLTEITLEKAIPQ